ncbi:hypothetical protein DPMN_164677 [Dreissena polymorpha]|uniref:S1 motif domain-containing protein n=1 Tax=Dreissena polymorpha TaxID=45954 RepID=A0A9D4EYZ3_DREPO|nr:hypothetical protein DPMN_164677 [Dreissena polymorpha]
MDEESFPRGGVREQTTEPKVKKDKQDKKQGRVVEKNLFGEVEESKDKKKRKKGRKEITKDVSKKTQKQTKDSDVVGKINILTPQILNKKSLYPGMLLLGSVKAIQSYSLTLALPNGLSGVVPIMHISAAYTESLERYSQHHEMGDTVENVSTLSELFHVGMVLPCRLRDYNSAAGDTKKLQLSVNPRDVNGDVQPASLQHGMCIYGSVSSIEDHGYIVDIGVKAVQCFLRHKQAKKFIQQNNHGEGLRVGQIVKCSLLMEGSRVDQQAGRNQVINVSIDPSEVGKHLKESSSLAFSALAPGMRVTAKVNKVSQLTDFKSCFLSVGTWHEGDCKSEQALAPGMRVTAKVNKVSQLTDFKSCFLSVGTWHEGDCESEQALAPGMRVTAKVNKVSQLTDFKSCFLSVGTWHEGDCKSEQALAPGMRVTAKVNKVSQLTDFKSCFLSVGTWHEGDCKSEQALATGMRVTAKVNKVSQLTDFKSCFLSVGTWHEGDCKSEQVNKVIQEKGMVLSFHKLKGVVHKSHVPLDLQTYTHRQEVSAVVLAIHPLLKTVHLSLLPHLVDYAGLPTRLFDGVKVSQILAGAVVRHVDKTRGVLLKWEDRLTLFAQCQSAGIFSHGEFSDCNTEKECS